MHIKTIIAGAAIALAAAIGSSIIVSATAAEQFTIMKDVPPATPLTTNQLEDVVGEGGDTFTIVLTNLINADEKSSGQFGNIVNSAIAPNGGAEFAVFTVIPTNQGP